MDIKVASTPLSCLHGGLISFTVYMLLKALSTGLRNIILFMLIPRRNSFQNSVSGMIVISMNNFHEKVSLFLLLMLGNSVKFLPYFTTCTELLDMHFV